MLIFSMEIAQSLQGVYMQVRDAAIKSGRNPEDIQVVVVSKTVEPERIKEAVHAGARIFGENRVQEARDKIEAFREQNATDVHWHMIGHLQRNKAKLAVMLFDLIHSVDSLELLKDINKEASKLGKVQNVLIQVKLSRDEETKSGLDPEKLPALLNASKEFQSINILGLMSMPPFFNNPEHCRPYFKKLRKLAMDDMARQGFTLNVLSMGMSNDFGVAIEEGATLVRVGTAIFGDRTTRCT
jgi:pyridoxal phosphate enzyme (YggS family)